MSRASKIDEVLRETTRDLRRVEQSAKMGIPLQYLKDLEASIYYDFELEEWLDESRGDFDVKEGLDKV